MLRRNQAKGTGSERTRGMACLAACGILLSLPACHGPTEIVLVVDTNLTKYDIDEVTITIAGSQPQPLVDVKLTLPNAPTFPLTLGLEPTGASGDVQVSVVGLFQGNPVVAQTADTTFVEGSQKMLRILLLDSCIATSCPTTPTLQTCNAGSCQPAAISSDSLPSWTDAIPAPPQPSPTAPIGGRTIWAEGWHSCANEGAQLYCWGQNEDGEIGDGTTRDANSRHLVMGVSDPAAVGLGEYTSCVCDRSGQAWCWGRNVEGELGLGSASANSQTPIKVPGVANCAQIAGGGNHTCVLHQDMTVSCWGSNASGQVGQPASANASCAESHGSPVPCITSPVLVPGLSGVVEIRAGEQQTCVRKTDQSVWCWGDNSQGQLGDGTMTSRNTPAPVTGLGADIVEIASGREFVCARHQTGTLSCWGSNSSGQFGNGNTTDSNVPVAADVTGAVQVGAGHQHTCVLRGSGVVSCWGANSTGQLGNGTYTDSLVPVDVIGLMHVPINSIAVGSTHSCARSSAGPAFCWGENLVNEIGDGTTNSRNSPVSVAGFM